ncbi:MAG: signal peptidase I [Suipraeoptans sp.]
MADIDDKKHIGKDSILGDFLSLILKIAAAFLIIFLLFIFIFGFIRYDNDEMNPSVRFGDCIITNRLSKDYIDNDLVVTKYKNKKMILRVIATAGDTVDITSDGLIINDSPQPEPDVSQKTKRYDNQVKFPMTLNDGEIFVLCDNRTNGTDSRVFGPISIKNTLGRPIALLRLRDF